MVTQRASACTDGNLVIQLADGVLTDGKGRTGYIASNYQFQFDAPAQAGAIYTAGYSLCQNNTLALGPTTTFFQCQSGAFWNLYDRSWAPQCAEVQLAAYPCASAGSAGAGQVPDGQVIGTQVVVTTIVKPIADGQPQVITTQVPVPMCQIGDGQVQAHTTPCASVTATPAPPTSIPVPVSQYSDGQIQVTQSGSAAPPPPPTAAPSPAPPVSSAPAPPPPAPLVAPNSTFATTGSPPKPSGAATTSAGSPSAPAQGSAGRLVTGPLVSLAIGLVGAVVFL